MKDKKQEIKEGYIGSSDQSSIPDFNTKEISLKDFHVTDTEYPIAILTFLVKDKEIVRRITLWGLLGAIEDHFANSVPVKDVHNKP